MKTLGQNARYSIRLLRKNPGFTLIAAITLALGIGANTAIFSVIYAVLLAPMPYPEPDQLVMVWSKVQGGNNSVAAGDYLDWKQQNKTFTDMNAWTGASYNFATAAQPEQINGRASTPGMSRMAGRISSTVSTERQVSRNSSGIRFWAWMWLKTSNSGSQKPLAFTP